MLRGNRGEWSELYLLLKLVTEGRVYGADRELNKIDDIYYDIIRMIRKQTDASWIYERVEVVNVNIINADTEEVICAVPLEDFRRNSDLLLREITDIQAGSRSFEVPTLEDFAKRIKVNTLAAISTDKADIVIKVHDYKTGSDLTQGFSIKSQLGNPATLINASGSTNFIYKIQNIDDEVMNRFNSIMSERRATSPDLKKRFEYLEGIGAELKYNEIQNPTFENNLILIDSLLPEICSYMLINFFQHRINNCLDNVKMIEFYNPLGFDMSKGHPFYNYKFRKMLAEAALGMTPSKMWNGVLDATGGYLIVKEDGEVLCYHLYNRVQFEEYLLLNTKFDTPSTSRHGFGTIYKEEDEYRVKLNLQVRFVK